MADFGKHSPQYTLRRKKGKGRGERGVVNMETENWELRFSQLRIRNCPMSIMAFEFPIMEMNFALSEF